MQSILILTDFSDNAFIAAEYASMLSRNWNSKRIVLYHVYQSSSITASKDLLHEIHYNMDVWRESIMQFVNPATTVQFLVDNAVLVEGIERIGKKKKLILS